MNHEFARRMAATVFAVAGTLFGVAALGPVRAEQAGIESPQQALLSRRFTMGVGRSIIVDLPRDAAEIVVANPAVANAVVRTPRKIFVLATGVGQTTILALDQQARQIANIELTIGRDVGELEQILRAALPKSAIVPRTINDTIILTGFVDSAGEAQQAVDIARGFANKLTIVAAPGGGAAAGAGGKPGDDGSVVNSLVIRGRDQVSLKVTIAEVQRQVLKQLGVATNTLNGEKQVAGVWGSFTQDNPFSLNGQVSKSALQFLGPNNTSVTLNAFERYGVSRVLAEPTVTAVSGENAKFTVGGEVPVPASSSCTAIGTTTQALCTPSIAYKPVGVELNFTPVVLSEGRILLRIATEVTEVDPQNAFTYAGVTVPGFRTRKHETSIELPSGGSIATAGLLQQTARNSINGLPAVMNLPILGALFRSRDYQRQETELLIVVTPYIVRPVAPNEIAKPDDGFADASDPQGWLLGRVNRLYSSRNNPEAVQNYKGRFGFITD